MSANKVITLRGCPDVKSGITKAASAIVPGMLIDPYGDAGGVIPHGVSAGDQFGMFALEADYVGGDIDTAYAAGVSIQFGCFDSGDEVNALLHTGQNIAVGDKLMSNGDGSLIKYVAQADTGASVLTFTPRMIVGIALEALNNTSGSNARLRIQIA